MNEAGSLTLDKTSVRSPPVPRSQPGRNQTTAQRIERHQTAPFGWRVGYTVEQEKPGV